MSELATEAYWVRHRGAGELVAGTVAEAPESGRSLVRAEFSGVSVGTERLVGLGLVPASCESAMACRYMEGSFALPLKYGYSLVGRGVAGALEGERVFVMHPHQSLAEVADEHAVVLPEAVPSSRAVLVPNLETALNAVWDSELEATPNARTVVLGAGAVGLLVAYALERTTGRPVTVVELDEERRSLAASLPWVERAVESETDGEFDVAFHTTGNPLGLQSALDLLGFEGRVIELSWYGEKPVTLDLGSHFHHGRKRIVASQVSAVAPTRRESLGYAGRTRAVLDLLDESALDALVSDPVPFARMPGLMGDVYRGASPAPLPLIQFEDGDE